MKSIRNHKVFILCINEVVLLLMENFPLFGFAVNYLSPECIFSLDGEDAVTYSGK